MILHHHFSVTLILIIQLFRPNFAGLFTAKNIPPQNITKRSNNDEVVTPVFFYLESPNLNNNGQTTETSELEVAASSPSGLKNFYSSSKPLSTLVNVHQHQPIQVFGHQESPKQLAEEQVLYEFQQTPTNAVSNVHVKQFFHPSSFEATTPSSSVSFQDISPSTSAQTYSGISSSPSIITSQQSTIPQFYRPQPQALGLNPIRHAPQSPTLVAPIHQHTFFNNQPHQNNQQFYHQQQPALQHHPQVQNSALIAAKHGPGKYVYLNGKFVYNPVHIIPQEKITPNSIYHKRVYHNQQKLPLINPTAQFNNNHHPNPPSEAPRREILRNNGFEHPQNLHHQSAAFGRLPSITNNVGFQPPKHLEQIDKPSSDPTNQDDEENKEEEEEENNEDEEEQPQKNNSKNEDEAAEDEDEEISDEEEDSSNENAENEKENSHFEVFPFEDDEDYMNEDDRHYFRAQPYLKNLRGRNNRDEKENDEEDDEENAEDAADVPKDAHKHYSRYYRNLGKSKKFKKPYYYYKPIYPKYKRPLYNKKPTEIFNKKSNFSKTKSSLNKPKGEKIQGKYSENIPITHKQKVFKERWYVTKKDLEGAASNKKIATRFSREIS